MASVGPETLEGLNTFEDFLEFSRLQPEQWRQVATELGQADVVDLDDIAGVDPVELAAAAAAAGIKGFARSRLGRFFSAVRQKAGLPPAELPAATATAAAPTGPATADSPAAAVDDGGLARHVLKAYQIWDQACRLEFKPVTEDVLSTMRERYTRLKFTPPSRTERLSDAQLSILHRLSAMGWNMLSFDMAVFGPFGERREQAFTMTAYQQNAEGLYIAKSVPGPQTLDEWLEAWAFVTSAFIHADVAHQGVMESYRDKFAARARAHPRAWWVAATAEWEFRHEFAPQELARQRQFRNTAPTLSQFDENYPWDSVLLAGVSGVTAIEFWNERLTLPAQKWTEEQGHALPSWVSRQEALFNPVSGGGFRTQAGGARGGMSASAAPVGAAALQSTQGRRAAKRARAASREEAPRGGAQTQDVTNQVKALAPKWIGNVNVNARRGDGRFMFGENGVEICYNYSRNQGCDEGACPNKRLHICEWCRGEHRSTECRTHPNWKPAPPQKGGGKGKRK